MRLDKLFIFFFFLMSALLANADYTFHLQAATGSCSVESSCSDSSSLTLTECEQGGGAWTTCDSRSSCESSSCGGSWSVDEIQHLITGFNPSSSVEQDDLDVISAEPPSNDMFYVSMRNSLISIPDSTTYYTTNILSASDSSPLNIYFSVFYPFDKEGDGEEIEISWDSSILDGNDLGSIKLKIGVFLSGDQFFGSEVDMTSQDSFTLTSLEPLHSSPFITIEPNVSATVPGNRSPFAHAGNKVTTYDGATVSLDGSGSVDPDLDDITYLWTSDSGDFNINNSQFGQYLVPDSSPGVCSDNSYDNLDECLCGPSNTYVVDSCQDPNNSTGNTWNNSTTFDITLTVSDGLLSDSDVVEVEVLNNQAPVAAVKSLNVVEGGVCTAQSYCSDGSILSEIECEDASENWTTCESSTSCLGDCGGEWGIDLTPESFVSTLENKLYNGREYALDGSGSYDNTDVGSLTYSWSIAPSGITLSDNSSSMPSFVAPLVEVETAYTATLTVTDQGGKSSSVDLNFSVLPNQKPVAYIADLLYPDITTEAADTLENIVDFRVDEYDIDGSLSSDINTGDLITYKWSSSTEEITISDDAIASPKLSVSSDAVGDHSVQLVVNDGTIDSDPFTLNFTVRENRAPIINNIFLRDTVDVDMESNYVELEGSQVFEGRLFKLNVGSSVDANQDNLAYSWQPYLCNEYSGEEDCLASSAGCNWSSGVCGFEGLKFVEGYLSNDSLVAFIADDGLVDGSIDIEVKVSEIGGSNVTTEIISVDVVGNFGPYAKVVNISAVEGSEVQLLSSGSFDVNMDALSYEWSAHSDNPEAGSLLSALDAANPVFSIPVVGEDIDYKFNLVVTDPGLLSSTQETLTVKVFKDGPSAPDSPKLDVTSSQGVVVLNWDSDPSEKSLDTFTSYSDFEGYRIYRSDDGGRTWGDSDDIIRDGLVDAAWPSIKEYDLSQAEDSLHCVEKFDFESDAVDCESTRNRSFRGPDPLAPWISLGSDSGLEYTYVDSSIVDGIEYLYSITAYDTGIQGYSVGYKLLEGYDYYVDTLSWPSSNPDRFYGPQGGVFPDYEACSGTGNECYASFPSRESIKGYFADMFTNWSSSMSYGLESGVIHNDSLWYAVLPTSKGHEPSLEYTSLWQFISPAFTEWSSAEDYDQIEVDPVVVSRGNVIYYYDSSGDVLGQAPEVSSKWIKMFPNLVSIIPGTPATNVVNFGFAGEQPADSIFISEKSNSEVVGNGGSYFRFINEDDLSDKLYLIEIDAEYTSEDGTSYDLFENYASFSPKIFIYEIEDTLAYKASDVTQFNVIDLPLGSAQDSLDLPGVSYVDESQAVISVPNYIVRDFPIKYLYESGYKNSWTDSFDGIRLSFINNVKDQNLLANGRVLMSSRQAFSSDGQELDGNGFYFRDWGVSVDLNYSQTSFYSRPSYKYKIEFFSDNSQEAVYNTSSECHDNCTLYLTESDCESAATLYGCKWIEEKTVDGSNCFFMTPIPFKVTNLTTQKEVPVWVKDNGVNETKKVEDGYGDCFWQRSEPIAFKLDSTDIRLGSDGSIENKGNYTFDLNVDYKLNIVGGGAISPWDETKIYQQGEQVIYHKSAWEAKEVVLSYKDNPSELLPPEFGSKWKPVHPWEDGDFVILEPLSWFVDGDAWVADLSLLGRPRSVTQSDIEKVKAVPNPYLVNSLYNESSSVNRMWFTDLPRQCELSIWTVSGDLVKTIYHDDDYEGKKQWNLRNDSGNLVAPGLYLYVVESAGLTHVGKFAVVR